MRVAHERDDPAGKLATQSVMRHGGFPGKKTSVPQRCIKLYSSGGSGKIFAEKGQRARWRSDPHCAFVV
jgi:hypothetical protein